MSCLNIMPLLVFNLGGEMIYILQQRLVAQKISSSKSSKVLSDVVKAMFNDKFVNELFRPQTLYTNDSTKELFTRIAHSSIMRLNHTSMSKLYDLMSMGVKYQIISCPHPSQIYNVTMNHLKNIKNAVVGADNAYNLVEKHIQLFINSYNDWRWGQWLQAKESLLEFFLDRKVKVSILLQNKLQGSDGHFIIQTDGPLPMTGKVPGNILYYSLDNTITKDQVMVANAENVYEIDENKHDEYFDLGDDMYTKYRKNNNNKSNKPPPPSTPPPAALIANTAEKITENAEAEFNLLSKLIPRPQINDNETFAMKDLFSNDEGEVDDMFQTQVIQFDGTTKEDRAIKITREIFGDNTSDIEDNNIIGNNDNDGDDDDLLALMDAAGT